MIEVFFTIPGKPVGKGRPRFARRGNYVQTYSPDATVVYENWVRECWRSGGFPKLVGPVTAKISAFFPIPKAGSKKRKAEMASGFIGYTGKPDTDNLAKCVLDSLNGMAFDDDSQVTLLVISKAYAEDPRCEVRLYGEEAPHD